MPKASRNPDSDSGSDSEMDDENQGSAANSGKRKGSLSASGKKRQRVEPEGPVSVDPSSDRFEDFKHAVTRVFERTREEEVNVDDVFAEANGTLKGAEQFSRREADAILEELERQNRIMYRDGVVHRI